MSDDIDIYFCIYIDIYICSLIDIDIYLHQ